MVQGITQCLRAKPRAIYYSTALGLRLKGAQGATGVLLRGLKKAECKGFKLDFTTSSPSSPLEASLQAPLQAPFKAVKPPFKPFNLQARLEAPLQPPSPPFKPPASPPRAPLQAPLEAFGSRPRGPPPSAPLQHPSSPLQAPAPPSPKGDGTSLDAWLIMLSKPGKVCKGPADLRRIGLSHPIGQALLQALRQKILPCAEQYMAHTPQWGFLRAWTRLTLPFRLLMFLTTSSIGAPMDHRRSVPRAGRQRCYCRRCMQGSEARMCFVAIAVHSGWWPGSMRNSGSIRGWRRSGVRLLC